LVTTCLIVEEVAKKCPSTAMCYNLSLTVPRYTNGRACDLNGLQEIIHVSRLSFFTHSCTRSFFVSSLKERNYTYSMYLSTVKVGLYAGGPGTTACGTASGAPSGPG